MRLGIIIALLIVVAGAYTVHLIYGDNLNNKEVWDAINSKLAASDQRYNCTTALTSKLDVTDKRYDDTTIVVQFQTELLAMKSELISNNASQWIKLNKFQTEINNIPNNATMDAVWDAINDIPDNESLDDIQDDIDDLQDDVEDIKDELNMT